MGVADIIEQLFGPPGMMGANVAGSGGEKKFPRPAPAKPAGGRALGGPAVMGGAMKVSKEEEAALWAKTESILKSIGVGDDEVYMLQQMTDPDKQTDAALKMIGARKKDLAAKAEAARKEAAGGWTPEGKEYIKQQYPEIAELIDRVPASLLHNIVSSRIAAKNKVTKPGAAPKRMMDRSALSKQYPDMAPYMEGLDDSDISDLVKAQYEQKQENPTGEKQYRTKKGGVSLRIVQDAAFQRSGLKSGDTVCVRIP